jgi:hypothetical protein
MRNRHEQRRCKNQLFRGPLAGAGRDSGCVESNGIAVASLASQRHYSGEEFRKTYLCAPPGLFSRRAWAYWGLMLLDDPKYPLPERFPGSINLTGERVLSARIGNCAHSPPKRRRSVNLDVGTRWCLSLPRRRPRVRS